MTPYPDRSKLKFPFWLILLTLLAITVIALAESIWVALVILIAWAKGVALLARRFSVRLQPGVDDVEIILGLTGLALVGGWTAIKSLNIGTEVSIALKVIWLAVVFWTASELAKAYRRKVAESEGIEDEVAGVEKVIEQSAAARDGQS